MILARLILTSLTRHRVRSAISIAGIAFSVAAMLTVVTVLEGAVGMFSGLLASDSELVVFERNVSDLFFSSVPSDAVAAIARMHGVAHADPVLFGIVSSADHPIITCFGITQNDARLRKATWITGSREGFGSDDGILLGERAASLLNAHTGSTVAIGHGTFTVHGVLRTANGFEDGGVFMPLTTAQTFFHKEGSSSVITVKLNTKDDIAAVKSDVQRTFPGLIALENADFNRSYSQFKILKATAWAVGACGLLLGGLGVANTMIMSVFTRIREIAILRVNGFSDRQIAGVVFGEAVVVSLGGALTGLLAGAVLLVGLHHIPALEGYVSTDLSLQVMLLCLALALLTGLAGALYPVSYALRIKAVEALRFE